MENLFYRIVSEHDLRHKKIRTTLELKTTLNNKKDVHIDIGVVFG